MNFAPSLVPSLQLLVPTKKLFMQLTAVVCHCYVTFGLISCIGFVDQNKVFKYSKHGPKNAHFVINVKKFWKRFSTQLNQSCKSLCILFTTRSRFLKKTKKKMHVIVSQSLLYISIGQLSYYLYVYKDIFQKLMQVSRICGNENRERTKFYLYAMMYC